MKKFIKRFLLTVLCVLFLFAFAACANDDNGSSTPEKPGTEDPDNPDKPGTEDPDPDDKEPDIPDNPHRPAADVDVATVVLGDVRIQLLSSSLVRVEQKGAKGFEDRNSYYVTNRTKWQVVEYDVVEETDETLIATEFYTVHVPDGASAEEVYITGKAGPLYSFAGDVGSNVYLPSPSDELKSWYFTDSPRIIPSEKGYSISDDDLPLSGWDFDNKATDIYVFLPNGSYSAFCKDYINLTGPSEMVTLNTLGYWDSRWYADSSVTALKRITDYLDKGYSIDVVVVDVDYKDPIKNGQWGVGYEINETLFPDMADFLKKCHELGVSVVFNDHPIPVEGTGNLLDKEEIEYRKKSLTCFLALGVDYWWYDRNWEACLNQIDPDISVYATGMYAFQFITQEYYESITDVDEYARRALIMGNVDGLVNGKWMYASDVSAHRYSIQWTGDIGTGSNELAAEIYNAVLGGAEVGIPYMSSDMGGFKTSVSNEQYIRWFQYCALSSVIRAHVDTNAAGQDGRMPWLYGEFAEKVAHTYQDMRYRLLPLYYRLSYRNYSEGLPILSRTDIAYPEYAEASANDQYLLGEHILVAPIAEAELKKVPDSFLSHTDGGSSVSGLKCEYFSTRDFNAVPTYVGNVNNIYFDFGTGSPAGLPADNFAMRFTGNITFDKASTLKFYADDDVTVYIDDKLVVDGSAEGVYDKFLSTPKYAAGSMHKLEVRYAERGANAHIYMYLDEDIPAEEVANSRDVFIPDGAWIDVWTGKRYIGPKTYTVTHTLETSPVFVREGAIVPLAKNGRNTASVLWDELALDVYPSKNFTASQTLYEDDVTTVAYKSGEYRTTDIDMTQNGNTTVITIGAAEGKFEGERAFTKRKWNLRLHKNPGWGDITSVKVNGKEVKFVLINKSTTAEPFAYSGASLIGDVYEVSFDAWVYARTNIEIVWSTAVDSEINADYDRTEVDFDMTVGSAGDSVKLDDGTEDWVSYGTGANTSEYISYPESYDASWTVGGVFFCSEYELDGKAQYDFSAIASNMNFDYTVKTIGRDAYYVFYVGGEYCTADFTVRDRAGNVQTVTFGNMDGAFTKRVAIRVTGDAESQLYVSYSINSGIPVGVGTKSIIKSIAALVSETLPETIESGNFVNIGDSAVSELGSKVDLTYAGETGDWMRFERRGHVRKQDGDIILGAAFTEESVLVDYPTEMIYSDGNAAFDDKAVREGRFAILGDITLTLAVTPENKYITLYAGAWKATCTAEVYTAGGVLLGRSDPIVWTNGDALCRKIVFPIEVERAGIIIVKLVCSDADVQSRGNVSLAAAVVASESRELPPPDAPTTTLGFTVKAYTDSETVNLTELGSKDWAYFNPADEKKGGEYIDTSSVESDWNNKFGDYKVGFDWSDGTAEENKIGGTAGIFGTYVSIRVKVDASVKKVRIWMGGYKSTIFIRATDSKGNILSEGKVADMIDGSNADMVEFDVNAEEEEYITFYMYREGDNVTFTAVAVA